MPSVYIQYGKITTTGSVVTLEADVVDPGNSNAQVKPPHNARSVLIQADGGDIHYRHDGTNPAAGSGTRIPNGDGHHISHGQFGTLKLWVEAGAAHISYYGTEDVQ